LLHQTGRTAMVRSAHRKRAHCCTDRSRGNSIRLLHDGTVERALWATAIRAAGAANRPIEWTNED